MLIVVNHKISDVAKFWESAKASLPNLPEGIKIHQVMPNADMNLATCLWEAPSIAIMREYLVAKVGTVSENTFMEVNEANAMGIPK